MFRVFKVKYNRSHRRATIQRSGVGKELGILGNWKKKLILLGHGYKRSLLGRQEPDSRGSDQDFGTYSKDSRCLSRRVTRGASFVKHHTGYSENREKTVHGWQRVRGDCCTYSDRRWWGWDEGGSRERKKWINSGAVQGGNIHGTLILRREKSWG